MKIKDYKNKIEVGDWVEVYDTFDREEVHGYIYKEVHYGVFRLTGKEGILIGETDILLRHQKHGKTLVKNGEYTEPEPEPEEIAVYCPTRELYDKVCEKAEKEGYRWGSLNVKMTEHNVWRFNEDENGIVIFLRKDNRGCMWDEFRVAQREEKLIISAEAYLDTDQYGCVNFPGIKGCEWKNEYTGEIVLKNNEQPEAHKKTGIKMKINNFMDKMLNKNTKKLIKAGFINGDLKLTPEGREALESTLLQQNMKEMVELADKKIKEEK